MRLLPLATEMANFEYGVCPFTYHAYGICVADRPDLLVEYGPYLQHRWMAFYEWLHAHNVPVPFFLGEGGHVEGSVSSTATAHAWAYAAEQADRYRVSLPDGKVLVLNKRRYERPPSTLNGLAAANMWLNPGRGWRGLISEDRAVAELVAEFDRPTYEFNKEHKWQACLGLTPFQWGNDNDWYHFNHNPLTQKLVAALGAAYGR